MIIMNKYDKNSLKAEEFINDGEILDSLKFADENKNNLELVDKIIEKARLKKGINHREASVLLACEDKERIKEITMTGAMSLYCGSLGILLMR